MKEVRIKPGEYMPKRRGPNDFFKAIALVIASMLIAALVVTCLWLGPEITLPTKGEQRVNSKSTTLTSTMLETSGRKFDVPTTAEIPNGKTEANEINTTNLSGPLFDYDLEDCHISYIKYELSTDYEGDPCLILYYTYTNKSDEINGVMDSSLYLRAYQNGVQCDYATISVEIENQAIRNYTKSVMPGMSLEIAESFEISDENDITFVLSDLYSNYQSETAVLSLK